MAQDSLAVGNGTGASVRQAINTAMQASATNQSGSSAPSTTYPFQFFANTTTSTLQIRNSANNGYINVSGVGKIGDANLGLLPLTGGTISGNLIVSGNLTVNGSTTTVDTTTLTVEDKNIEIGKVGTPTDTTADGGGLTLLGSSNKTWNWVDATDSWTSSENIDLASGKVLKVAGTQILSATNFTGTSAIATNVTVADESSDTSCNVLFTTGATGNLPPKTGTNLTFNSATGALTATSFNGNLTGTIPDDSVTSAKIVDGTIVNADINASAAIEGTKISPNFGSQNLATTGTATFGGNATFATDGTLTTSAGITVQNAQPGISFVDTGANPDFIIQNRDGSFAIRDTTNAANRFLVNMANGAITGTGDMTIDTDTFHVDSTNNRVGVGTTSPTNKLVVNSAAHDDGLYVLAANNNQSTRVKIQGKKSDGTEHNWILEVPRSADRFGITNGSNTHLAILDSGNVGLGTTNPLALLDVTLLGSGSRRLLVNYADSIITVQGANSSSTNENLRITGDNLIFSSGSGTGTERLRINSSGNVGIGTSSPVNPLHVVLAGTDIATFESTDAGSSGAQVSFMHTSASPADNDTIANLTFDGRDDGNNATTYAQLRVLATDVSNGSESGAYQFFTRNAGSFDERMRIDSSGKVGIGETSMDALLVIKGASDASTTPSIRLKDGSDTREAWISNTAGDLVLANGGDDNTPHCKLQMFDGNIMQFSTANTERLRIDSSGRVGIGTTTGAVGGAPSSQTGQFNVISSAASGQWVMQARADNAAGNGLFLRAGANSSYYTAYLTGNDENNVHMVVRGDGNVGIGTASPDDRLVLSGSTGDGLKLIDGTHIAVFRTVSGGGILKTASNHALVLGTNDTERMRIDSSGFVLISCTSFPSSSVAGVGLANTNTGTTFSSGSATNNQTHIVFINGNGVVGTIKTNGSATSFNTTSDYRLKENAVAISDGITRLKTLKPYKFNFKADPSTTVDGFFAHEVTAVPEAISGTKDEVALADNKVKNIKKGDPIYQGIDQSKLVPLLTAALQETIAKIEVLETKVAALEAA